MTALPLTPTSAAHGHLDCHYFNAGVCRSCSLIETPYPQQISDKESWCREVLGKSIGDVWLPAASSADHSFRNRAKLAVGGVAGAVTLGILDQEFHGVDLRECGIQAPAIRDVIPVVADILDATDLDPYDVANRRGELKFVHITAAPSGDLMIRFVVRSRFGLEVLTSRRAEITRRIPAATVVSVNLLPEHKAVLEGSEEFMLLDDSLRMNLDRVDLHLRPQSFFQTNTAVASELYNQVSSWVDVIQPREIWDLYCGVGGFALYCAQSAGRPHVTGVEISDQAIESARRSAADLGVHARFRVSDATEFAEAVLAGSDEPGRAVPPGSDVESPGSDGAPGLDGPRTNPPDCVIVNPPRRGIGERLSSILESSDVAHVIYSSCNPLTLATDLQRMPSFEVTSARVFDMFPHTKHLEVAVVLQRR